MKNIGERVKELRIKSGLKQSELAEALGFTSGSSVSKIEKNERRIPPELIAPLADLLKTNIAYLLGVSDDPAPGKIISFDTPEDFEKARAEAIAHSSPDSKTVKVTYRADGSTYTEVVDPVFDRKLGEAFRRAGSERQKGSIVVYRFHTLSKTA